MTLFEVTIHCSPVELLARLGVRPPAVAKGGEHVGMVALPNERLTGAYMTLKEKLSQVDDGEMFTVELTEDERAALFYEVTATRVTASYTGLEITETNFPVITGLILSGFVFPEQSKFYL